jgi:glyoxylate carboligase
MAAMNALQTKYFIHCLFSEVGVMAAISKPYISILMSAAYFHRQTGRNFRHKQCVEGNYKV